MLLSNLLVGMVAALWLTGPAAAQSNGKAVFEARCQTCHEPAVDRAPSRADLAQRPQADIATSTRSLLRLVHMLLTKDILSKGLLL